MKEYEKLKPENYYTHFDDAMRERMKGAKWGFGEILQKDKVDVEQVIQVWKNEDRKLYDERNVYFVKTEEVSKYIKKLRNKRKSLTSWWVGEDGKRLTGVEKWEYLLQSIKDNGWDWTQPAVLIVRKKRRSVVINGHHRLAVALELGLKEVPVCFLYR